MMHHFKSYPRRSACNALLGQCRPHAILPACGVFPLKLALMLTLVLTLMLAATQTASDAATRPLPNVVFILADDLGYGDVQAINHDSQIPTPNLNGLARAGITFTDAHSPSAVCTPTRYGILTGRYCWRSPLKRGVLNGYSPPLIPKEMPTVARLLKQQGYVTGIVGKWHLGLGFVRPEGADGIDFQQPLTHGPNDLGFDYSYIIPASLDFPPYVFLHDHRVTDPRTVLQPAQPFPAFLRRGPRSRALVMEDCLDTLTDRAVGFITEHADRAEPFFLYFPLSAPHKPVLPHRRFRGKSELGPYGDFVLQVDDAVGRVLTAIEDHHLSEKTLVIFTSDNGSFMYRRNGRDHVEDEQVQAYRPEHHRPNGPLRGTKADIWEAGHRVPTFARWPKQITPSSHCDVPVCSVDLLATMADLCGIDRPASALDSHSLLPLLRGEPQATRPPVIHHSAAGMFAIRQGDWKLVLGNGSGGRERPSGKPFARPYGLFNLRQDIAETQNRADEQPEVALELEKTCLQIIGSALAE